MSKQEHDNLNLRVIRNKIEWLGAFALKKRSTAVRLRVYEGMLDRGVLPASESREAALVRYREKLAQVRRDLLKARAVVEGCLVQLVQATLADVMKALEGGEQDCAGLHPVLDGVRACEVRSLARKARKALGYRVVSDSGRLRSEMSGIMASHHEAMAKALLLIDVDCLMAQMVDLYPFHVENAGGSQVFKLWPTFGMARHGIVFEHDGSPIPMVLPILIVVVPEVKDQEGEGGGNAWVQECVESAIMDMDWNDRN